MKFSSSCSNQQTFSHSNIAWQEPYLGSLFWFDEGETLTVQWQWLEIRLTTAAIQHVIIVYNSNSCAVLARTTCCCVYQETLLTCGTCYNPVNANTVGGRRTSSLASTDRRGTVCSSTNDIRVGIGRTPRISSSASCTRMKHNDIMQWKVTISDKHAILLG